MFSAVPSKNSELILAMVGTHRFPCFFSKESHGLAVLGPHQLLSCLHGFALKADIRSECDFRILVTKPVGVVVGSVTIEVIWGQHRRKHLLKGLFGN